MKNYSLEKDEDTHGKRISRRLVTSILAGFLTVGIFLLLFMAVKWNAPKVREHKVVNLFDLDRVIGPPPLSPAKYRMPEGLEMEPIREVLSYSPENILISSSFSSTDQYYNSYDNELEERVYNEELLDEPAKPLKVSSVYPLNFINQKVRERVIIEFVVNRKGSTQQIRAINPTSKDFALKAMRCVKDWQFKPAEIDGEPVASKLTRVITSDY